MIHIIVWNKHDGRGLIRWRMILYIYGEKRKTIFFPVDVGTFGGESTFDYRVCFVR